MIVTNQALRFCSPGKHGKMHLPEAIRVSDDLDFGDLVAHDDKTKRTQQFAMRCKDESRHAVNEHGFNEPDTPGVGNGLAGPIPGAMHLSWEDPVPDDVWDEAARHYDEQELAALLLNIAIINVWNRLNVPTRQVAGEWVKSAEAKKWVQEAKAS